MTYSCPDIHVIFATESLIPYAYNSSKKVLIRIFNCIYRLKTAFVKFDTESQLQEAQKIQKRHGKIIIDGFRSNMKVVDLSHHQTESLMEAGSISNICIPEFV